MQIQRCCEGPLRVFDHVNLYKRYLQSYVNSSRQRFNFCFIYFLNSKLNFFSFNILNQAQYYYLNQLELICIIRLFSMRLFTGTAALCRSQTRLFALLLKGHEICQMYFGTCSFYSGSCSRAACECIEWSSACFVYFSLTNQHWAHHEKQ